MPTSSLEDGAPTTGNFDPLWPHFRPPEPGWRLLSWVEAVVPPDAPVLPFYFGTVPLVKVPKEGLLAALRRLLDQRGQRPDLIAAVLARPPVRDGLPRGYPRSDAPPEELVRREGEVRSQRARPYWQMEAAYLRDIGGATSHQLGSGLGLSDAKPSYYRPPGQAAIEIEQDRSRGAERDYLRPGRKLLAELGAWPWAIAEGEGKPPRQWWTHPEYLSPLARWHRAAWLDMLGRIEFSAARLGDANLDPLFLASRYAHALTVHKQLCEAELAEEYRAVIEEGRREIEERVNSADPSLMMRRPATVP